MLPEIEYQTHKNTAEQVCAIFPGLQPTTRAVAIIDK